MLGYALSSVACQFISMTYRFPQRRNCIPNNLLDIGHSRTTEPMQTPSCLVYMHAIHTNPIARCHLVCCLAPARPCICRNGTRRYQCRLESFAPWYQAKNTKESRPVCAVPMSYSSLTLTPGYDNLHLNNAAHTPFVRSPNTGHERYSW